MARFQNLVSRFLNKNKPPKVPRKKLEIELAKESEKLVELQSKIDEFIHLEQRGGLEESQVLRFQQEIAFIDEIQYLNAVKAKIDSQVELMVDHNDIRVITLRYVNDLSQEISQLLTFFSNGGMNI